MGWENNYGMRRSRRVSLWPGERSLRGARDRDLFEVFYKQTVLDLFKLYCKYKISQTRVNDYSGKENWLLDDIFQNI